MKVSERIAELRALLNGPGISACPKVLMESQLIQLEVDVVAMVQEARYTGFSAGFAEGLDYQIGGVT